MEEEDGVDRLGCHGIKQDCFTSDPERSKEDLTSFPSYDPFFLPAHQSTIQQTTLNLHQTFSTVIHLDTSSSEV
jgi:hypothetical protein